MLPVEKNLSGAGLFQPGDQPQEGRFTAARRSEKDAKLAVADLKGDVLQDFIGAELLREPMHG
jgi:hypothetical protein